MFETFPRIRLVRQPKRENEGGVFDRKAIFLFMRGDDTAVGNRSKKFWFKKEISEACAVDTDIRSLFGVLLAILRSICYDASGC